MNTEQKFYIVTDSSTTSECPVRTHEIVVDGVTELVTFKLGEQTILPEKTALKFMLDGFKLSETDGSNVPFPAQTNDVIKFKIGADEVVAKLDELTVTALQMRAVIKPNGEKFIGTEFTKEDLIEFLMTPNEELLSIDSFDGDDIDGDEKDFIDTLTDEVTEIIAAGGEIEADEAPDEIDVDGKKEEEAPVSDAPPIEENTNTEQPPVNNENIEDGATEFTDKEIDANKSEA